VTIQSIVDISISVSSGLHKHMPTYIYTYSLPCPYLMTAQITDGGAAERDGQLQVGHRILEVNGVSLLGASHIEAVKALRSSPDQLSIIVCNGYDPKEVLRRRQSEQGISTVGSGFVDCTVLVNSNICSNVNFHLQDIPVTYVSFGLLHS